MPVSTVARSAGRERSCSLDERGIAGRVPKSDLVGGEVDLIGNVVPLVCLELGLPLALATHHPLQVGVRCTGLSADPAVLQLCEVALKEGDLVLVRCTRYVCTSPLDREVVVHCALVDSSLGLRNKLSTPHVLCQVSVLFVKYVRKHAYRVPLGGAVDCDLCALLRAGIAGVLERRRKVDIFGGGA
jgi:hypothetical protein